MGDPEVWSGRERHHGKIALLPAQDGKVDRRGPVETEEEKGKCAPLRFPSEIREE